MLVAQQPIARGSREPGSSGSHALGYTLWMYDGESWKLKKDCSSEGASIGQPPVSPGKFRGQIRATSCVAD
ncbi:hypothetical protein NHH03_11320 [Stieleria sp. TO1_6]|uniref:hypothetical protein n=1 Tax=Stieleria tagensis TaxID=2956795 RepID=UPI00209BB5C1|nr:hypothetical protein [Stieleria tagensis]MCO8122331.1 hypothetical protein [Stieleria tagensis]